jgi:HlyD family secretion protein
VFKGKLTEIGSSALQKTVTTSEESRDFKVVITLENPPYRLKPGLSASADIILAEKKDALSVPISALVIKEKDKREEEGIYIVDAGRVKFQPVSKGITGGMYIEISEGLKVGQEFVSGPYAALRDLKDGILVKAAPAVPAGKAAKSK